jgi:hypothetical protein
VKTLGLISYWNKLNRFYIQKDFHNVLLGPTSATSPDAAPLAHSTFLPPGGFRPRPGIAARYNSRRDLFRSQRGRNKEAVTSSAITAIEMEERVPRPLPVRRGATREDEDAILVHSEPNVVSDQQEAGRESEI